MEEKKTRFVVWSEDYYGRNGGCKILGRVNTFAEAQEVLVKHWAKHSGSEDIIEEILSHTEAELEGRESLTLYGSNCYFSEGIARVPGYVDEDEKEPVSVTLGEILRRELVAVGDRKWRLNISKDKNDFYLWVDGCNKAPIGTKYENIAGLPTHYVRDFYVYASLKQISLSDKDFTDVDWTVISAEDVNKRLGKIFLAEKMFYSEEAAIASLPNELVINRETQTSSISPYDRYGYHIEGISAYCSPYDSKGVFIHIRRN